MINYGGISPRSEVLNIDDVRGFGSYISHHMKFVNGSSNEGVFDGWLASKNDNGFIEPTLYAKEVRKSEVSRAISAVQRKTLSIDKILELRKAATISCSNSVTKFPCDLKIAPCLFDIYEDPCEENNLANTQPLIRIALEKRYQERKQLVVPSRRKPSDPACDPVNFNLNWNWWQKDS